MISAVTSDIFYNVMGSSGFYFDKKMHAELLWRLMHHVFLVDEMERLSHINWNDVGMPSAL